MPKIQHRAFWLLRAAKEKKKRVTAVILFCELFIQTERLFFADCGELEGGVQWAKANHAGEQKDDGQDAKNDCGRSRNKVCEIQNGYNDCQNKANNAICASHILFHDVPPKLIV